MVTTENTKLLYQLSYLYQGGRFKNSGTVYPKHNLMPSTESNRIWAKRAYKKGYADLVEDTLEYTIYSINQRGLELLKEHEDYYLHKPVQHVINNTRDNKEELKKQRRRERRLLRKLKQLGDKNG